MARSGAERIPQPSVPERGDEREKRKRKKRAAPKDEREKMTVSDRPKGWKLEKPTEPQKPEPVTPEQWERSLRRFVSAIGNRYAPMSAMRSAQRTGHRPAYLIRGT